MLILFFTFACSLPDIPVQENTEILGEIKIDLDASKNTVRTGECLVGNMVADAFKEYAFAKGYEVDFAFINGGNIRAEERPDGIYPAGEFTKGMAKELFPWENRGVIITVTGVELKSIMERSVALLPEAKGCFLQVSRGFRVVIDTLEQPQILDETGETIIIEVSRIVSIKINDMEYNPTGEYNLIVIEYIADGGDYHLTFRDIPAERKTYLNENILLAIENYIRNHSPVEPALEGRITFQ